MVSRKVWVANLVVSLILAALVLVDAFLFDIPFIYNDPPNFWGLGGFLLVAVSSGFQLRRSRRGSESKEHTMNTTKKSGWPLILAIVAAAVVLALFLWPRILSAGAAHTDWTRQEAQRFIADYQAESGKALDEKRVCWDLAYLDLIGIQPTSISGERDGRVVYAHQIDLDNGRQYVEYVDVKMMWHGTAQYHITDNRQADNLMIKYPWGGMKIDGQMFF